MILNTSWHSIKFIGKTVKDQNRLIHFHRIRWHPGWNYVEKLIKSWNEFMLQMTQHKLLVNSNFSKPPETFFTRTWISMIVIINGIAKETAFSECTGNFFNFFSHSSVHWILYACVMCNFIMHFMFFQFFLFFLFKMLFNNLLSYTHIICNWWLKHIWIHEYMNDATV